MGSFVFHQEAKDRHFEIIVKDRTQAGLGGRSQLALGEKRTNTQGRGFQTNRDLLRPLQRLFVMEEKINRRPF